jgi:phosphoribosylformylglycinamidine synthase
MFQADIKVTLKKTVADPQGLTIKHALDSLGYKGLDSVRAGKFFIIKLKSNDKARAEQEAREMCEKLLVNPVIEEYSFEIKEIK